MHEDIPTLCNFRWSIRLLVHNHDKGARIQEQKCTMKKNHKGDHISWARVTAANEKET